MPGSASYLLCDSGGVACPLCAFGIYISISQHCWEDLLTSGMLSAQNKACPHGTHSIMLLLLVSILLDSRGPSTEPDAQTPSMNWTVPPASIPCPPAPRPWLLAAQAPPVSFWLLQVQPNLSDKTEGEGGGQGGGGERTAR